MNLVTYAKKIPGNSSDFVHVTLPYLSGLDIFAPAATPFLIGIKYLTIYITVRVLIITHDCVTSVLHTCMHVCVHACVCVRVCEGEREKYNPGLNLVFIVSRFTLPFCQPFLLLLSACCCEYFESKSLPLLTSRYRDKT